MSGFMLLIERLVTGVLRMQKMQRTWKGCHGNVMKETADMGPTFTN